MTQTVPGGFYQLAGGPDRTHAWFSHNLATQSSLYILSRCNDATKSHLLQWARGPDCTALRRPLALDAFLVSTESWIYQTRMVSYRSRLVGFEKSGEAILASQSIQSIFQNLHDVSYKLHALREDLTDLEERLTFLMHLWEKWDTLKTLRTKESLDYLAGRTQCWRRWAGAYQARADVQIQLFFNLANQGDNRTNLEIAKSTKSLAEESRKDSSSMITIAVLTMVFLPGTFISVGPVAITIPQL